MTLSGFGVAGSRSVVPMSDTRPPGTPTRLLPETTFLVQLRSDCRPEDSRVSGRVEHLRSGNSEPFASLAELLTYMARHTRQADGPDPVPTEGTEGGQ